MTERLHDRLYAAATALLLAAIPILWIHSQSLKSATFDEPINLIHGVHALGTGDVSVPMDYAPLTRLMSALSLELLAAPLRYETGSMPWAPGGPQVLDGPPSHLGIGAVGFLGQNERLPGTMLLSRIRRQQQQSDGDKPRNTVQRCNLHRKTQGRRWQISAPRAAREAAGSRGTVSLSRAR